MASSLLAFPDISRMASACCSSCMRMTLPRVKSEPWGSNFSPTVSMSCPQCLSLIAGFLRSTIRGMVRLKASTVSLMCFHIDQLLISLPILTMRLLMRMASSSMFSTSRSRNMPSFQVLYLLFQSLTIPQIVVSRSRSFSDLLSSLN